MTAVRPPARFGAIKIIGQKVKLLGKNLKLMRVGLMVVL